MGHVTYDWVMSHMNASCHIWWSHVTYEWVMSPMSHVAYDRVMLRMNETCHVWMSRVTLNQSCHIWMGHVTYDWVMSHRIESCHIWLSHVTYEWVIQPMIESCHIWRVMSRMNQSCHTRRVDGFTYKTWKHNKRKCMWKCIFIYLVSVCLRVYTHMYVRTKEHSHIHM